MPTLSTTTSDRTFQSHIPTTKPTFLQAPVLEETTTSTTEEQSSQSSSAGGGETTTETETGTEPVQEPTEETGTTDNPTEAASNVGDEGGGENETDQDFEYMTFDLLKCASELDEAKSKVVPQATFLNMFGYLTSNPDDETVFYDSTCCGLALNQSYSLIRLNLFLIAIHHIFISLPQTSLYASCSYTEAAMVIMSKNLNMKQECQTLNQNTYTFQFNTFRILIEGIVCLFIGQDCSTSGEALFGFGDFIKRLKIQRLMDYFGLDGFQGVFQARMPFQTILLLSGTYDFNGVDKSTFDVREIYKIPIQLLSGEYVKPKVILSYLLDKNMVAVQTIFYAQLTLLAQCCSLKCFEHGHPQVEPPRRFPTSKQSNLEPNPRHQTKPGSFIFSMNLLFSCFVAVLDLKFLTDHIGSDQSFDQHPQKIQLMIILLIVLIYGIFINASMVLSRLDSHEVPRSYLAISFLLLYSASYIGIEYKDQTLIEAMIFIGMLIIFFSNFLYIWIGQPISTSATVCEQGFYLLPGRGGFSEILSYTAIILMFGGTVQSWNSVSNDQFDIHYRQCSFVKSDHTTMRRIAALEGLSQTSAMDEWSHLVQFLLVAMITIVTCICVPFLVVERNSKINRGHHFQFAFCLIVFNIANCLILVSLETIFETKVKIGVVQALFKLEGFYAVTTAHVLFIFAMVCHILCSLFSITTNNADDSALNVFRNPEFQMSDLAKISIKKLAKETEAKEKFSYDEEYTAEIAKLKRDIDYQKQNRFECKCEFRPMISLLLCFVFTLSALILVGMAIFPDSGEDQNQLLVKGQTENRYTHNLQVLNHDKDSCGAILDEVKYGINDFVSEVKRFSNVVNFTPFDVVSDSGMRFLMTVGASFSCILLITGTILALFSQINARLIVIIVCFMLNTNGLILMLIIVPLCESIFGQFPLAFFSVKVGPAFLKALFAHVTVYVGIVAMFVELYMPLASPVEDIGQEEEDEEEKKEKESLLGKKSDKAQDKPEQTQAPKTEEKIEPSLPEATANIEIKASEYDPEAKKYV